jgi:hypothetical protein
MAALASRMGSPYYRSESLAIYRGLPAVDYLFMKRELD